MAKNQKKKIRIIFILLSLIILGVIFYGLLNSDFAVLDPQGVVAHKERSLIALTVALGMLVVLPVFALTAWIAWHYRESNHKAKYSPEFDGNFFAELIWWAIPTAIILTLSIITWNSSHELDPKRSLSSNTKPMTIQVIALQWRWLFIYPEQNIATLNYVQFPEKTPVDFEITADAPMNSFWIPKLGGQIYAMPGMSTHLHLMADQKGSFRGSSANISGKGFSGMDFTANALSKNEFTRWISDVRRLPEDLNANEYLQISKPSVDKKHVDYASSSSHLYDKVVMKYMMPGINLHGTYQYGVAK